MVKRLVPCCLSKAAFNKWAKAWSSVMEMPVAADAVTAPKQMQAGKCLADPRVENISFVNHMSGFEETYWKTRVCDWDCISDSRVLIASL
ncbi:hypothetical protein NDU88_001843 [Pleurodeles waltl]|uniref:Uncharacterized protein n=1 Tax=Pleurodeles waltl TaxID=8319 RepID=A0AAV7T0M8_PLEWA|nr:hypothetical protein NDU88_001843 [Pleurodeles waltl]